MNIKGKKICDNCFSVIKGEPCPNCGFKWSKYKPEFGTLPVGTMLAKRYAVGKVLGKGGFGVTYKAYDTAIGKIVAVKEYYPNGLVYRDSGTTGVTVTDAKHTENFQSGADKFYMEAKTISKFNGNPNIVGVYEFFYENNTVYYVMEYLEGQDLKQYLKKNGGKLSQEKALYVAEVMTDALLITHSLNVLHRDISPDNIYVLNSGELKLIDFGAARQVFAEQSKSLSVILKQGFAPLELYQRRGKQGPWTDVYALGATLFYALTGNVMDDATERLEDDSIGSAEQYGVDPAFWAVIEKCVAVRPENRYQSVLELKQAISGLSLRPVPLIEKKRPEDIPVAALEGFQTAGIGATVAVSDTPDIGATVAVSDTPDIGATVAVSDTPDIGATVAVSDASDIGATVAVSDAPDIGATVAMGDSSEIGVTVAADSASAPSATKKRAAFKLKPGIIIAAAAVFVALCTTIVFAAVLPTVRKNRNNSHNDNTSKEAQITSSDSIGESGDDEDGDNTTSHTAETSGEGITEPDDNNTTSEDDAENTTSAENGESVTERPTEPVTQKPTEPPTVKPTEPPTVKPTEPPTVKPTEPPTVKPTEPPTEAPTTEAETYVTDRECTVYAGSGSTSYASAKYGNYTGDWRDGAPNGQGWFISTSDAGDYIYYTLIKGNWSNGYLTGIASYVDGKCFSGKSVPTIYTVDWSVYAEGTYDEHEFFDIYRGTWSEGVVVGESTKYYLMFYKGSSYVLNGETVTTPDRVEGKWYTCDFLNPPTLWALKGQAWNLILSL